ncbi:hypothetical protein JCM3774_002335 [Rhodotorula dairenensis]
MDYRFINHDELADIVRTQRAGEQYQVVDVRDDDFRGGNIKGAIRAPSEQRTDQSVEDLVTRLDGVPRVIFHCTLSQVRGPKAARIYAEARRAREGARQSLPEGVLVDSTTAVGAPQMAALGEEPNKADDAASLSKTTTETNVDPFETAKATVAAAQASTRTPQRQEVLVLRDGFQGWQGLYRKDPDLVENFDAAVWQEYSP